jgi:hypothetical protein
MLVIVDGCGRAKAVQGMNEGAKPPLYGLVLPLTRGAQT